MLSFIVIGKNEGWRLEKCLSSIQHVVIADGVMNWEIIYVDSKSTDDSVDLARRYGARVFLITGACNAAVARNIGAREAHGDILFFIDGDMEIMPGFLSRVMTKEQKLIYPFISGIFNDVIHDIGWNYVKTTRRHNITEGDADAIEMVTGGLFIVSSALWNLQGGMDTRFKRSQDYDFGLRMVEMGFPLHRKSIVLANHYTTPYIMRSDYISNAKYSALLFRKHWNNMNGLILLLKQWYTSIVLVISALLAFISPWFLSLYVAVLIYKDIKQHNRVWYWLYPMLRDMVFVLSVFFYYPKELSLNYKQV